MVRDMTDLESRCLDVIRRHEGKDDPISFQNMAVMLNEEPRKVRRAVEALIKVHRQPVCSSYDSTLPGYFWPRNRDELQEVHDRLFRHGVSILVRASRLMKASEEEVLGQIRMQLRENE